MMLMTIFNMHSNPYWPCICRRPNNGSSSGPKDSGPYNHCHAIFVVREAADITYEPIGLHLTVAPTQLFAMFPDLAPIVPYTPEEMHNPTDEDPEPQALLAIEPSVGSTFND